MSSIYEYIYNLIDAEFDEWFWEQQEEAEDACAECFDCYEGCAYAA